MSNQQQNSSDSISETCLRRFGRCYDCKKPKTGGNLWRYWCHACYSELFREEFSNWTSGNEIIDKFIQKKQLDALDYHDVIEWIPFDKFKDIEPLGGPEPIFKVTWIDGHVEKWKNNKWVRPNRNIGCCLKKLNLSSISNEEEVKNQLEVQNIRIYGITKDPKRCDYMIVIDYRNLCKKCYQLKARNSTEHWETWCSPCNSKLFEDEFKNWTSGNEIIDKFIQKKQLEALKYYEVVEWIPFDRFNNIEVIKGEFGSVIKANWIDGSIRSWDNKNNKWSRIFSNEAYCLRIISDISDISEIENQYKVRNTDARNLINYIAICGITKNPENHNYMVVMGYQDVCDQCLWPPTEKKWCNSCNSKRFQDEFKNWTSGNEIIDKYIQEKQLTALNRDDAIEWISFDTFKDVCLIEGEFGTALRANLIVNFEIDDDDVDEEWAELMEEWVMSNNYRKVCIKSFDSSNITNEFLLEIETQSRLPNFREDRKNLITVYGITKDPEKHDFMIVTEYNEKKICYKCLLPNTGEYWCNKCNSKYFQNEFEKWTSDNELIDEFIQKKQLEAINTKEFIEWIHFDKLQDVEQIGQGGFGTAFKATWIDGYIWRWNHENNEWKRTSEFEVCLKRLDKSHTVSREFLREVETQLNAQRYGNTIPIYGITKDPEHDDYMIVMDYAKVGSLRKMLNEQYSNLSWQAKLQNLNYIAYALAGIHEANLVHKDLHSGNIVMTDIEDAWITDFGLCKPVTSDREKDIYGVLPYIAPEVLLGGDYTEASDVYSFGIIMSEFLTGFPPYHDIPHDYSLAVRICQGLRPINPEIRRGVPQLLLDLMDRCLHVDPLERQTSGQVQNSVYYYLINSNDTSTEIGKQIEAIENSNITLPKFDPSNYTQHSSACYTSRRFNIKDIREYAASIKTKFIIPEDLSNFTFDEEPQKEGN